MSIDPSDPAQAIDGAARYLKGQLDRFGSVDLAARRLQRRPRRRAARRRHPDQRQTQAYVPKVLGIMNGARW